MAPRQVLTVSEKAARVERVAALALALLLLRSAFAHLGNPYAFLSTVYSYQITGVETGKWIAVLLPYLQIVVAVCLIARWWLREAYLLALGMLAVFVGAQTLAVRQGLDISCGCFGTSDSLHVGQATLVLAAACAAAAMFGWIVTTLREYKATCPTSKAVP